MYSNMLTTKLEENMKRSSELQQGFQKIKNATGLSNVDEILAKFMSRDETFEALEKAAAETEEAIEVATQENQQLQRMLESIQLQGVADSGNRQFYREIDEFDAKVAAARKAYQEAQEKSKKANVTLENVRQCVVKLQEKFNPGRTIALPPPEKLPECLAQLERKVNDMISTLAMQMGASMREGFNRSGMLGGAYGGVAAAGPGLETDSASSSGGQESLAVTMPAKESQVQPASAPAKMVARANDLLFNSLMSVEPDQSPRNVRVPISTMRKARQTTFGGRGMLVSTVYGDAETPVITSLGRDSTGGARADELDGVANDGHGTDDGDDGGNDDDDDDDDDGSEVPTRHVVKRGSSYLLQRKMQEERRKAMGPVKGAKQMEKKQQLASDRLAREVFQQKF